MTEDDYEPFINDPEPTHYKFRVRLTLDIRDTFREVMRRTKLALSEEFDKDTKHIEIHHIQFKYPGDNSEIMVSVRGLVTRDSLDDVEERTEKAMLAEFNEDNDSVRAPCIDTLP